MFIWHFKDKYLIYLKTNEFKRAEVNKSAMDRKCKLNCNPIHKYANFHRLSWLYGIIERAFQWFSIDMHT